MVSKKRNYLPNLFQRIFDHEIDLTLAQYRVAMDVICSMAYDLPTDLNVVNNRDNDALREQIDLMVTKQVTSSILK